MDLFYLDYSKTSHEKINGHRELTVSSRWPRWSRLRGPMITTQSRLGKVTAQSRWGHSSITARSQLAVNIFSMITAQSRLGHSSITAQVTAGCDHFGRLVSSHGGQSFSHGLYHQVISCSLWQSLYYCRHWYMALKLVISYMINSLISEYTLLNFRNILFRLFCITCLTGYLLHIIKKSYSVNIDWVESLQWYTKSYDMNYWGQWKYETLAYCVCITKATKRWWTVCCVKQQCNN